MNGVRINGNGKSLNNGSWKRRYITLHGMTDPGLLLLLLLLPSCFLLALSQMYGLMWTMNPSSLMHFRLHIITPRQDFFSLFGSWLFVLRIAHPLWWALASGHEELYAF